MLYHACATASLQVYQSSTAHTDSHMHHFWQPPFMETPISAGLELHQLAAAAVAQSAAAATRPVHEGGSSHLCTWSISALGV